MHKHIPSEHGMGEQRLTQADIVAIFERVSWWEITLCFMSFGLVPAKTLVSECGTCMQEVFMSTQQQHKQLFQSTEQFLQNN